MFPEAAVSGGGGEPDSVFLHQDFLVGDVKHHNDVTAERLDHDSSRTQLTIYYSQSDAGELHETGELPDTLLARLAPEETVVFQCTCSFIVSGKAVKDRFSSLPMELSIGEGTNSVVYQGVYLTLRENDQDIYDLLLQVNRDGHEHTYTFGFSHASVLSPGLPLDVLNRAAAYLQELMSS